MPAITCGWCQAYTNVEITSDIRIVEYIDDPYSPQYILTAAFICLSCKNLSVARWISDRNISDERLINWKALKEQDGVRWYPLPGSNKDFNDVPEIISIAASEAWRCHVNDCPRAAVMTARAVVEASAKSHGYSEGTLAQKITSMSTQGLIRPALAEQLNEIRHIGNESAHGDLDTEITDTDAYEVLELMAELLNELWQAPARAKRLRERRIKKEM